MAAKSITKVDVADTVGSEDTIIIVQNGAVRQVSKTKLFEELQKAITTSSAKLSEDLSLLKEDTLSGVQSAINEKVDGAYVEEGYLYLTANNEIVAGPLGPFSGNGSGGGGGSEANNATLSLSNVTGWISRTIPNGDTCELKVRWSSVEDEIPTGDGALKVAINGTVRQLLNVSQGEVTVDVTQYLVSGTNTVKITIEDTYGNRRSVNFSIASVSLSLSSTFDDATVYSGDIVFSYTPVGAVTKKVYLLVDGKTVGTNDTNLSNRQMTFTIPKQAHGAHTVECYFDCQVNGQDIRSNTLYYEIVCVDGAKKTPIITSSYAEKTVKQYSTIGIPYIVYDPADLEATVEIYANGDLVSTQNVSRARQTFTYRTSKTGALNIKFVSGSATKSIDITVEKSDIDVEAETDQLKLYLTSSGRSNNEDTPSEWSYGDIKASLTGFNYTSDGWKNDADGVTVLRVSGDARVEIPYKPFENDPRTTGKTIEIEFATRNIMNYDSQIMACMSGGRGFALTPQKATLKSEQSEIFTSYKEDEHARITFVIEKRAENRLVYCYINGIMSGVVQYSASDDFSQSDPVNITIGSNDCTTDIYCIRVYDNDLTRHQVLNNWVADTQNANDMFSRFQRNRVYDEYGNIVINQLPSDLPYMIFECDELPQYKGDKKTVFASYVDPVNPANSFTCTFELDVQGTSSQYYERKNYKCKCKTGFTLYNGIQSATYNLRPNAVATNVFTLKADVASSEGANNVELARLYNDACPYKTPAQKADSAVRQGIDGFPIVVFWSDTSTNQTVFMGKYNFNNDKGTAEVFGFEEGDESWEILNNTSDRVLWKSADYSGSDWLNDFEARFPDTKPPYEDSTQLAEFAQFVVSTDTTKATGNTLSKAVTYNGVSYTKDTAEYRLAKFSAEVGNYVEMDSAMFYYLFTELFLMVDSRAKNMFPSMIGGSTS